MPNTERKLYPDYNHTHLVWFVTGAVRLYFEQAKMELSGVGFDSYVYDTIHKTIMFLEGRTEINASFSDHQCDVAAAAKKYFGTKS